MRKLLILAAALLGACASPPPEQPVPITAPGDARTAPVVRAPLPDAVIAMPAPAPRGPLAPAPSASPVQVPPGLLYVCVTEAGGERRQVGIEFVPKVQQLCQKHPEMGPCQYERDVCRRSGGRVYAASGEEITLQTEAEYDRKVMRVRFRAN